MPPMQWPEYEASSSGYQQTSTPPPPTQPPTIASHSNLRPLQPQPYAPLSLNQPAYENYMYPDDQHPVYDQDHQIKRMRISRACDACRRKKIKCDTTGPGNNCKNCVTARVECTFNVSAKKRGPPKGYIEVLENRLKRMERILGGLAQEDSQHVANSDNEPIHTNDMPDSSPAASATQPASASPTAPVDSPPQPAPQPAPQPTRDIVLHSQPRYLGDVSTLPFLASKFNFDGSNFTTIAGARLCLRKFGQSLVMYQTSDEPQTRPPNVMLLEYLGRLKPDEPIDNIDQWIAKVSGIDKLASDRLLKIYFAYIHPGLPVVNKQLFLKQYRGLADDYPSAPLLSAMYGAAARYIETCSRFGDDVITQEHWADPQKNWQLPPGGSERLFDNLLAYVRGHYHPGIDIIQALVIAQNHRATMEGKVTGGWLINSAAIRMAQDLGLHRSSESWDIPESEKETRRRVWWAVYIMDKWTSASTGRPQTVFDEDCDEKYPSESASWEEVMDVDEDDDAPGPRFPSLDKAVAQKAKNERIPLYQPFVQLVKLSGILGRVLQGLYTPRAKKYSAEHGSDAIVSFLDKSLSEWRSALPPTLQLSGASARKLDTKGKTPLLSMSGLMYLSYCTLLILLHRPFIEDKGEKKSSVSSLNICISAATRCVDIAERMHYRDFLLVSWNFAIYHVFTASLIHIYSVSKSEDSEAIATATEYLIKSVRLVRRLSKLSFAASQIHLVLMRLMKMRNVTIDDDDLMLDNESEGPTSANASHAAGKKAEHPSHQGSANPSPSNTNMPLPTTHGHDDHYGNTSASSTPTSLTNGDWINGLYSSMQSDGPPSQGQTASSSVELDPTSLQKFGMTMEQMFTPIEQIQQQQPPPPQPPMPLASPSSFNVMPLASQPSFLFSLWNSPSSHQYGNIPGYATPSSSLSSPSQANNTTISNNTNISNNSPSMPQTMPPSQPVNYMFPMMDQSSFRYHPDNPFWSVPSSLEMNDWAAYLFPSQQQVVQTPQSPSQKQSWTNNWM